MPVDLTEVRFLFFEESFENIDVMESNLLDLEIGTIDKELINSIFRAAHSIKGGAGIFKLEQLVTFAHICETLLDEMRNGEHLITQTLIDLLLRAVDIMRIMLSALQENTTIDLQAVQTCQNELLSTLKKSMADKQIKDDALKYVESASEQNSISAELSSPTQDKSLGWHIVFKPHLSMLTRGNDPINLFHELSNLGQLDIKVDTSQLPTLTDLDPQSCYLSWELTLQGQVEQAIIEEIFEWVEDECELQITALSELNHTETMQPAVLPSATPILPTTRVLEEIEEQTTNSIEEQTTDSKEIKKQITHCEENQAATTASIEKEEQLTDSELIHSQEQAPDSEIAPQSKSTLEQLEQSHSNESIIEEVNNQLDANREPAELIPLATETTTLSSPTLKMNSKDTITLANQPQVLVTNQATEAESTRDNTNTTANTHVSHHSTEANSIRVSIDKIDNLINLVGELVITQSMLDQVKENWENTHVTQLHNGLSQLERNTRELQESVMRIRMLPISYSFNRFPRLVHDLSVQLGKKVELKLSGEHTELDKTVLEKMSDPLVHLVRNALDHGIELPAQRRAAGKPETGELHLHAFHQGGNIVIQISDDGAGFDLEKIHTKAIEKGLLAPDDHPSEEQFYELIFLPGFSTATQVSNVSGRGVGMDVVRRNIRALGGTIEVISQPGKGSTFSIRLPLTLAILDGQLVRVGKEIYILSLLSIIESLRIKPALVNSLAGKAEVYRLREEYIPILRLYDLFGITPGTTQLDQGLLVIVEGDGQRIGLFVDELLSQQQIVIKSLESNYKQIQGISGATILGDGSVALILDVAGLIQLFYSQTRVPLSRSHSWLGVHHEH